MTPKSLALALNSILDQLPSGPVALVDGDRRVRQDSVDGIGKPARNWNGMAQLREDWD